MKTTTFFALSSLLMIAGCSGSNHIVKSDPTKVKVTEDTLADRMVKKAQAFLEKHPKSAKAYNDMGLAYAQKGRESGQLDWYDHARDSFEIAHKIDSKDEASLRNLAYVSTIFHSFQEAIKYGKEAISANEHDSFAYGVVSDSYFELGDYDQAVEFAQKMVDLKPDLGSYSRAAKLRWVYGDAKGAIFIMQKALNAGAPFAENTAWCSTMLGDMYFKTGALLAAEIQYKDSLNRLKDYRHACAGMSRVCFAKNKLKEAAEWMTKACIGTPPIPYVTELGEIYQKMGKADLAREQFKKVQETSDQFRAHGIGGDEVVLCNYWLDHTDNKVAALAMMEKESGEHVNVETYSTLAWAYYKNNRPKEAEQAIKKAMRTGIQDSLVFYRASRIAAANGKVDESRKLALLCESLNPHFSMIYSAQDLVAMK